MTNQNTRTHARTHTLELSVAVASTTSSWSICIRSLVAYRGGRHQRPHPPFHLVNALLCRDSHYVNGNDIRLCRAGHSGSCARMRYGSYCMKVMKVVFPQKHRWSVLANMHQGYFKSHCTQSLILFIWIVNGS